MAAWSLMLLPVPTATKPKLSFGTVRTVVAAPAIGAKIVTVPLLWSRIRAF